MSIDWQARYRALRDRVKRYDRALRAYGLLGEAWVDHSAELDELYSDVLRAAELPVASDNVTERPDD